MAPSNPFRPRGLRTDSVCFRHTGDHDVAWDADREPSDHERQVHRAFHEFILNDTFPCVGGRSALSNGCYWHGIYKDMGSDGITDWLCSDIFDFVSVQNRFDHEFSTLAASFSGPASADDVSFEQSLWDLLQRIHDLDRSLLPWDPSVSADPADPDFAFSIAERGFFIVGLHPSSSRLSRRFTWPTLVFNAEYMFQNLERSGRTARFQEIIRGRDLRLQGSINPNLDQPGVSRAREYSGRPVPRHWKCPLTRRVAAE